MNALQLDFFYTEEESELEALRKKVEQLEASQGKVRRALFARHGELIKGQIDLNDRLGILEKNICKGKL